MEQPHVTIRDIANLCRASTATISRALNNRPGVSAALRRDIMAHARRIGYTPDQTAKALRSRHSNRVYFVIPSDNNDEAFFQLPSKETLSM
jgi:DNA-binding LacI/PurR family transcriptional regulator